MVDLSTFVENRQQNDMTKKRRQVVGDRHRVPVPQTRFDRAVSVPKDQKLSMLPFTSSRPIAEPLRRRETRGFDTDAESVGESMTMNILPKANRPAQTTQNRITDEGIALKASVGFQHPHDHTRGQYEGSSLPDNQSLVSKFDDDNSGESDSDKYERSHNVRRDLLTETQSEEFINFKKLNVLNQRYFGASRAFQAHAPDPRLLASSYAPINAKEETIPTSSRSPTPAPEYDNSTSNPKSQHSQGDILKTIGFPNHRVNRNDRDAPSSIAVQNRLAEVRFTNQHREYISQPLSLNTQVNLDTANGMIDLISVPEVKSTEIPFPLQSDHENADRSILGSESSDGHGPEVRIGSSISQRTLKRKPSLDHRSDQLHNMSFQDLLKEPFDGISTPGASLHSSELVGPPLRATLEQLSSDKTSREYHFRHHSFFEKLSLGQYVECGEILAEKLSETISNLSRIRQEKRGVVSKFEEEIVQREAMVRGRVAALKMKKGVMTRQTEELTTKRTAQMESRE